MLGRPGHGEFRDRRAAGRLLAERVRSEHGGDIVVVGLPNGGVPVAAEVARAVEVPLEVIVVRRIGIPFQPLLGMGAVGEGGVRALDEVLAARVGVTQQEIAAAESLAVAKLESHVARYRGGRPAPDLTGRLAVIVDDGVTTGATAAVACTVARRLGAARIVLAVPVGRADGLVRVAGADAVVCLVEADDVRSIASFYDTIGPITDEEVVEVLAAARQRERAQSAG